MSKVEIPALTHFPEAVLTMWITANRKVDKIQEYAVFEKGTDISNLKGSQIEVLLTPPPNKENYMSIQSYKDAHPLTLPPCKPVMHFSANP